MAKAILNVCCGDRDTSLPLFRSLVDLVESYGLTCTKSCIQG